MWQDTAVAVGTSVYAGVTILLLGGVIAAFLQLRLLRRSQQLSLLDSWLDVYRGEEMLEHTSEVKKFTRQHREEAPFRYCAMHAAGSDDFGDLHNHRRQMSQLIGKVAKVAYEGIVDTQFVLRAGESIPDDIKFLIGVQWRLQRQVDYWDGSFNAKAFHRWALLELFIADSNLRAHGRYSRFQRKTWWAFRLAPETI